MTNGVGQPAAGENVAGENAVVSYARAEDGTVQDFSLYTHWQDWRHCSENHGARACIIARSSQPRRYFTQVDKN